MTDSAVAERIRLNRNLASHVSIYLNNKDHLKVSNGPEIFKAFYYTYVELRFELERKTSAIIRKTDDSLPLTCVADQLARIEIENSEVRFLFTVRDPIIKRRLVGDIEFPNPKKIKDGLLERRGLVVFGPPHNEETLTRARATIEQSQRELAQVLEKECGTPDRRKTSDCGAIGTAAGYLFVAQDKIENKHLLFDTARNKLASFGLFGFFWENLQREDRGSEPRNDLSLFV